MFTSSQVVGGMELDQIITGQNTWATVKTENDKFSQEWTWDIGFD